jgi:hypothetical protein
MKVFSFVLMVALLLTAIALALASPPTKARQSVAASHVHPLEATQVADVAAPVQIKNEISIAKYDNSVVGANTMYRNNEVAARARSGVQGATRRNPDSALTYKTRRVEADIGGTLLL